MVIFIDKNEYDLQDIATREHLKENYSRGGHLVDSVIGVIHGEDEVKELQTVTINNIDYTVVVVSKYYFTRPVSNGSLQMVIQAFLLKKELTQ